MQAFARLLDALSYQPARNGKLRLIEATTRGYNELTSAQLLEGPEVWAPMALSDGTSRIQDADEAGLVPLTPRPGLVAGLKAALLTQKALITGRPYPRHGFLAARSALAPATR